MSPISVKIPLPSYLKKYLLSLSVNKREPVEFACKSEYNRLLINLVSNRPDIKPDRFLFNDSIKIKLPFSHVKDVYFYNKLNEQSRQTFIDIVKTNFYFDFYVFSKRGLLAGVQRKKLIESFFESHNILEDDLKLESFYRNFTRYLEKIELSYSKLALTDLKS